MRTAKKSRIAKTARKLKRRLSRKVASPRQPKSKTRPKTRLTRRQQKAEIRGLAAINRVRRGESPNLSSAARAERTTVKSIREWFPAALIQDRPGGPIRVKASDRYSARVEILTDAGALVVTGRGSRERQLAGQHRATYMDVVRGKKPASALERFRGKKVAGHELLSDYARLVTLSDAGVLGQLDALYVSAGGSR